MKRTIIAVAFAALFAAPAIADTSDGTPRWRQNADHSQGSHTGSTVYPAAKAPTSVYGGLDWNRDQTWAFNPGQPISADELKAQQAVNTAHRRAVYDDLVQAGGCNGDFLPVEYAGPCGYTSFGKQTEGGNGGAAGDGESSGGAAE